jgi:ABC-type nitrate/sulfonate/bicarbonate transport system substrate-binding protein
MLDFAPNADDAFIAVGKKFGYFANEGIELVLTNPPSQLNEIPTLVALGHYDVGISVVPSTLLAKLNGAPLLSVAGWAKRSDGLIFYPPGKIKSPHDLVGKQVATYNSLDYIGFLTSYLASAGLKLSDIHLEYVNYTPPLIATGKVYGATEWTLA